MKKFLLATAALLLAMPAAADPEASNRIDGMAHPPALPTKEPAPTIAHTTAYGIILPRAPRARGIPTALAVEGALEANRVCLGNTYKTTAEITNSAGVPIVMISNDGAAAITQRVAMSKVQAVLKYHMTSGEVAAEAAGDPPSPRR